MSRRFWLSVMAVVGVVGALGAVKTLQIQSAIAQASAFQPPPEAVTTIVARTESWPTTVDAIGTVQAVRGVTLSADLPGVVEHVAFESGRAVREGEVLVRLDARQERAQLAAAEAQKELARANLARLRGLVEQGIVAEAELDRAVAEARQAEARVGEIRATLERKQVRAPFSGVLGIRQVNLGQYLNAGDPIVSLQSLDPVHVNFSVPQQSGALMRTGSAVEVRAEGRGGQAAAGRITAVDAVIDEATRNVRVQATLPNPDGALRPGMFVNVQVGLASSPSSTGRAAPATPGCASSSSGSGDRGATRWRWCRGSSPGPRW
ncbi:MAG: efflux RND transporter periplasmic adaptor subunit [Acidimicrobiales bacterium]|nr:efflux RND transporter periplasmic adaptor subunit [Acidimicrobiales bacterium]